MESYFKKVFNSTQHIDQSWNVVITDSYPSWLKNTGMTFDSFDHHVDVYLLKNTSDLDMSELSLTVTNILVDDGNATKRQNHVFIREFGDTSLQNCPTLKSTMALSNIFKFCVDHFFAINKEPINPLSFSALRTTRTNQIKWMF